MAFKAKYTDPWTFGQAMSKVRKTPIGLTKYKVFTEKEKWTYLSLHFNFSKKYGGQHRKTGDFGEENTTHHVAPS